MQYGVEKVFAAPNGRSVGKELEQKIRDRSAHVGIIGLGYVGLPLALEMGKAGFQVTGIDIDNSRAESVNAGRSYILDVPSEILQSLVRKGRMRATQSLATVENLDAVSIWSPHPWERPRPRTSPTSLPLWRQCITISGLNS